MRLGFVVAALMVALGTSAAAEVIRSSQATFRLEQLTGGLERPWALAFLPDGRMLVTERPGRLRLIEADGTLVAEPVAGLPGDIVARGQGGLLDVALAPDVETSGLVYLSYSAGTPDGSMTTQVVRGRLDGATLADVETVFTADAWSSGGRHFGSRLVFDAAGHLYVTVGDRGDRPRAQDLDDHVGVVLRLTADGGVPDDNPLVDGGGRAELFSWGNRNAQGMAVHPETGEVWAHEHGPRGGDEVNVIRAGTNYGWPVITHGIGYSYLPIGEGTHKEGMAQPVHFWDPSIAPSGMAFYTGDAFPEWRGDLFVGALRSRLLARLELDGERVVEEERLLEGEIGRIRDVRTGPDGLLYLLTDETDGGLWRLAPVD